MSKCLLAGSTFIHCSNEFRNPILPDEVESTIYEPNQEHPKPRLVFGKKDKAEIRKQVVIRHLNHQGSRGKHASYVEALSDVEVMKIYQDDKTRRRLILRAWPRDPEGKSLPKTAGKCATAEKLPWGASLLDFFVVRPFPKTAGLISFSTTSRLGEAMLSLGEMAKDSHYLRFAREEEDPRPMPPYDIAKLILEDEHSIRNSLAGRTLAQDSPWWTDCEISKSSVFNPSRSPVPWPMEPFSYHPAALSKRLQINLLPRTLYVHATPPLLSASYCCTGIPRVLKYRLQLTTKGRKKAEGFKEESSGNQDHYECSRKIFPGGFVLPPVYALMPSRPPIKRPEEAHLFMSANHRAGLGNHSYVYHADWDLPRDVLVPDLLCKKCVDDDVSQCIIKKVSENESQMDSSPLSGKCSVPHIDNMDPDSADPNQDHIGTANTENKCHGAYREVESSVEYQNPSRKPYCSHIQDLGFGDFARHPLTARVRVAAKLSVQGDNHLEREAENYQRFPDYFFEHHSGYHLVPHLRQVVPVGAIVPQFYGYYVPDRSCKETYAEYLSPILLLEACGSQIRKAELSVDDKNECASLAYRFKQAGWNHRSIAPRNFLYQPGPLWKHPSERGIPFGEAGYDSAYSFRIIDFGRSVKKEDVDEHKFMEHYHDDISDVKTVFDYSNSPI